MVQQQQLSGIAETPKTDSNVQEKLGEEGCRGADIRGRPREVSQQPGQEGMSGGRWQRQPARSSRGDGEQFPELASRVSGVLGSMHFSGVRAKAKVQGRRSDRGPSVGASPLGTQQRVRLERRQGRHGLCSKQMFTFLLNILCVCVCPCVHTSACVQRSQNKCGTRSLLLPLCGFQERNSSLQT